MFGSSLGASNQPRATELCDIEVTLDCSLEELYQGSLRSVEFERSEVECNPRVSRLLKRTKQIQINPGYSDKTVLVFKGEGHQSYECRTSSLVIKLRQVPHKCYARLGDDLVLTLDVSLEDTLNQSPIAFKTLDGRKLVFAVDSQISP